MLPRSLPLVFLFSFFSLAVASPEHAFDWKFPDNITNKLAECAEMSISTITLNASTNYTGTPPFYFTAYEMGGIPTVQVLTPNKHGRMNWIVDHQAGSSLALSMIDSEGKSGGMAGKFFHVTSSSQHRCFLAPPNNPPRITANVTSPHSISTCDPWGLSITGGIAPYNVTLVALNTPTQVNMTLGPQDNVLTFIDRISPASTLIAAVLDAHGNFGTGTLSVRTQGSKDTSCTGAVTRSHPSVKANANAKRDHTIAITLSATFTFLFAISVTVYLYFRRRRRHQLGLSRAHDSDKSTDNDRWFRSVVTPAILRRPASTQAHTHTAPHKPLPPLPPQHMAVDQGLQQRRAGGPGDMSEIRGLQRQMNRLPTRSSSQLNVTRRGSQDSMSPLVRHQMEVVERTAQCEDTEDAATRNELPPPYRPR